MRTRIKICGFTRKQDALCAARLGVDALGLVFYSPSPRNISIETAADIINSLPAFVSVVGLFVNEQETVIREIIGKLAIDLIQFHGDESAEYCRSFGKPYIKAVRMREDTDFAFLTKEYHDTRGLLLDAYHADARGGTGSLFNWELIPEKSPVPLILAGGLEPANVRNAVKTAKPYALDVSSGVESSQGIKDAAKMAAFVNEVYQGDRD